MKTKFHLNKRPSARPNPAQAGALAAAVALIDERYLGWLAKQQQGRTEQTPPQRAAYAAVLGHLARLCGAEGPLLRSYVFTDQQPETLLDDLVLRLVPAHASDGGAGLVRALGLELTQLAQRGGCGLALLASDDERLIPYIDEAQWRGLKVVLVTDEAALDFGRLLHDDPSWARLLMQADRRVSINDAAWAALANPANAETAGYFASRSTFMAEREDEGLPFSGAPMAAPVSTPALAEPAHFDQQPDAEWTTQVQQVIADWWREETPHARLDLFEEMQNSAGVPPETDRHLLLRVRRALGRTLSFPEKKAMREMIRNAVLAQPPVLDEAVDS